MMNKGIFILTAICFCLGLLNSPVFAQEMKIKDGRYSVGEVFTIESKILKETRTLYVSCPPEYERGNGSYPVIYVLDGNGRFPMAATTTLFLSNAGRIPEFIVVGIANIRRPDSRGRDMAPPEGPGKPSGVKKFQGFMEKELIPYVDKKFRTQPYRILYGHSLAGLYTFYTMFTKPNLFNAYISSSPSIMYREKITLKALQEQLAKGTPLKKYLYLTVGDEPRYIPPIEKAVAMIKEKQPKGLDWKYVQAKGERHSSMPLKALYNGLETIFKGFEMPPIFQLSNFEINDLRKRFAGYSKRFGFQIRIPEALMNYTGYVLLQQKKNDKAIEAFKYNVEMYPNSPNAYDSLGEGFEVKGDIEAARKSIKKAVEIAEKTKHPMLNTFKKSLERINKKKSKPLIDTNRH